MAEVRAKGVKVRAQVWQSNLLRYRFPHVHQLQLTTGFIQTQIQSQSLPKQKADSFHIMIMKDESNNNFIQN